MTYNVISQANFGEGCILEMAYDDCKFAGFKKVTNIIVITFLTHDGAIGDDGVRGFNCNDTEYHLDPVIAVKAFDERFKNAENGKFGCSSFAKPIEDFLEKE